MEIGRRKAILSIGKGVALFGSLGLGMRIFNRSHLDQNESSIVTLGNNSAQKKTHLTEVLLRTNKIRQVELPLESGHSALEIRGGKLLCIGHKGPETLLLDKYNKIAKKIIAPTNYLFGGHGLVDTRHEQIVLTAHRINPNSEIDTGLIQVYSMDEMELISQYSSEGIHPHEVRLLPEGDAYVVTHYGLLSEERGSKDGKYTFDVLNPKLSVFSAGSHSVLAHYPTSPDYAIVTHMDIGLDGKVFAVNNAYWKAEYFAKNRASTEMGDTDFLLTQMEHKQNHVAVPLPLIVVDPRTGKQQNVFSSVKSQRRSQSIATNFRTGKVIATYTYSNCLLIVERDLSCRAIDCSQFGIVGVRGVCEIPGTSQIVITGTYRGIAVIDLETMKRLNYFDVPLHFSIHVGMRG